MKIVAYDVAGASWMDVFPPTSIVLAFVPAAIRRARTADFWNRFDEGGRTLLLLDTPYCESWEKTR
ncbi:MAG: hypothetical protein QM784_38210 [Polyangiaceae bacterium]